MKSFFSRQRKVIGTSVFFSALLFLSYIFLPAAQESKPSLVRVATELPREISRFVQPGDVLLVGPGLKILFGANSRSIMTHANYAGGDAKGTIIGLLPDEGTGEGQTHVGTPVLRSQNRTVYAAYTEVKFPSSLDRSRLTIQASGLFNSAKGKQASINTTYTLDLVTAQIDISSVITNTGKEAWSDLAYSLLFDAFHNYSFSPYHENYHRQLNFRFYSKRSHALAWISLNPPSRPASPLPGRLAPGESFKVNYVLMADARPDRLLEKVYNFLKIPTERAKIILSPEIAGWKEIVITHILSGATFFRGILEEATSLLEVPLPEAVYRVRGNLFPAVTENILSVEKKAMNTLRLRQPLMGRIRLRLQDSQGRPVPGKVTFIGLQPTRTPYFRPENPLVTSRAFESFKNSCYPPAEGMELELPVGTYLVSASRGPEYSIDQRVIEIIADSPCELVLQVERVVEKPGLLSLDPHVHTIFSDGTVSVASRLQSLIAEGVEMAIATDHNVVTNYLPVLARLGWEKELTVLCGSEVTMPDMLHFNLYPLSYQEKEERKGTIEPVGEKVSSLFAASRAKSPGGIIQVNHPRAGTLGYFNNYQLDLLSAAQVRESFDFGFDLLEVMNGASPLSSNAVALQDWLHLLNRGRFYPLVGSSDSHTIDGGEPGYARTYVLYDRPKEEPIDVQQVLKAIRQGKCFASTGPLVDFRVNGQYTFGDTVSLTPGPVTLKLKVWSAPWIEVDEVRILSNGERRLILPVKEKRGDIVKMEEEVVLQIKEDTAVVVEVIGKTSLYPVLQQPSDSGRLRDAALPYAITNPIFIDTNGDGQYNHPWPGNIEEVKQDLERRRIISR